METGSILFILIFLPLTALVYYLIPIRFRSARNNILLLFSLVFYAWGSLINAGILVILTICNYFLGLGIGRRVKKQKKGAALRAVQFAVGINVIMLIFFVVNGFLLARTGRLYGSVLQVKATGLPLGMGIYLLSSISYLLEVYKEKAPAETDFTVFALYVAMFPKIVAGPMVPFSKLREQLTDRNENLDQAGYGVGRFVIGLAKYVFLAAFAGELWSDISAGGNALLNAWIGALALAGSIYFTWSGFADMAVGLGSIFGFEFGGNFKYPLTSKSHEELWKRFNISVTGFFKAYVEKPLRDDRKTGSFSVLIAWALYGLWYGASWSCLVGGVYFGVFLLLEKGFFGRMLKKLPTFVRYIYMIITSGVGIIFFSGKSLTDSLYYVGSMFGGGAGVANMMTLYYLRTKGIFLLLMVLCALPAGHNWKGKYLFMNGKFGSIVLSVVYALLFILCICWIV